MKEIEQDLDVIIVGGGPAGLSAAHWCAELGLRSILLEKSSDFGGQLLQIHNPITNYPGIETANGREMRDRFLNTVERSEFIRRTSSDVVTVDVEGKSILLNDGTEYEAKALVIATGVSRRRLNIPGETEFAGRGILSSGAKEKESVRGKDVVIVGGGDAAMENAIILSEFAEKVTVIHRRKDFTARREFIEEVCSLRNVEILTGATVQRIDGNTNVHSIELIEAVIGRLVILPADAVLIRIGVEPNSKMLAGKIELDPAGYIVTDNLCRTSSPEIFAVGDVANPISPTISTAAGTGATAAKAILSLLQNRA